MLKVQRTKQVGGEDGNVLFLILIAVALFAALSYAVTQSSRSGGGDTSETTLISSAQITQYPASIRTSIIRMLVSGNVAADELIFDIPSDFTASCGVANVDRCVFHPKGGGATYSEAPPEVVTTAGPQEWIFNSENEINLVGTTIGGNAPDVTSADIIAFLPNVTDLVCRRLNEQLGIGTTIPPETGIDVTAQMDLANDGIGAGGATIGEGGGAALDSQPFGCFVQTGVNYYYHVLLEQ
jgi:hypothetical protein